jgi:hypothetical protein
MQTAALIIAVLLAIIIILLIVLLLRTRRLAQPQILLKEEVAPLIVTPVSVPSISRYPLYDLRRQPSGMLNIPPPPRHPVYFNHPNGGRVGRGPHYYS